MVETRGSATSSKEGKVYERSTACRKTEAKTEPAKAVKHRKPPLKSNVEGRNVIKPHSSTADGDASADILNKDKGQAVNELSGKGIVLEGSDTMSKCTTQKVKKPLSLNVLHAISIRKQTEATKRSKLIGGTVGSKDVDKESSAKKTTGCGVEHEKNSSDSIPESDKSTNNEDVFGKQTVEDTTVKKTNNKGTSCMSGWEKNKVTMKNVSLDQVSGKEIVEQTITKDIVGEKIDGDMAVGEASEKGYSGVSGPFVFTTSGG
ncbi:uncharacterized protein LOC125199705 [Salvia hispanica]|uniref:uncharacterized protein LOC125191109 n=1 Tax=Salvia hispanica TaxID=49212 RepID=UPI002008F1BA|nr:uncharacterized protein LOC125191109 [Salvia hispanica]XP_047953593.1 uncharacterized protein LOC125199705 [Salvia hispanica]